MVMMISNQDKKLFYDEIWSSCSLEKEEGGRGKQIKLCFVSNFTDDGRCKAAKSNVFIQKKHLVHRGWRLVNIPHPGWWLAQGYEDFLHPFHYPDKFCHTKPLLHKSQGLYILIFILCLCLLCSMNSYEVFTTKVTYTLCKNLMVVWCKHKLL